MDSSFKILEHTQFELRLISIHQIPGTGEKEEGIVWRFGVGSSQLDQLKLSYPI